MEMNDQEWSEWVRRFNEKWESSVDGCWLWRGAKLPKGYGIIKIPGTRRQEYAHRLAWRIRNGPLPKGAHVLHRCDVPSCVNPDHLFLGDAQANASDMKSKDRHLYGERNTEVVLTAVQVRQIKVMLKSGQFSQKEIGRFFGVAQTTISKIHLGERWAHVK